MNLTIGGTDIEIPEDLINTENFVTTALRVAPNSIHIRVDERTIRTNWAPGDLAQIGERLESFEDVVRIAKRAKCKKVGTVGVRLAELYLSPEMRDEIEREFNIQALLYEGKANESSGKQNSQELVYKLVRERELALEELDRINSELDENSS